MNNSPLHSNDNSVPTDAGTFHGITGHGLTGCAVNGGPGVSGLNVPYVADENMGITLTGTTQGAYAMGYPEINPNVNPNGQLTGQTTGQSTGWGDNIGINPDFPNYNGTAVFGWPNTYYTFPVSMPDKDALRNAQLAAMEARLSSLETNSALQTARHEAEIADLKAIQKKLEQALADARTDHLMLLCDVLNANQKKDCIEIGSFRIKEIKHDNGIHSLMIQGRSDGENVWKTVFMGQINETRSPGPARAVNFTPTSTRWPGEVPGADVFCHQCFPNHDLPDGISYVGVAREAFKALGLRIAETTPSDAVTPHTHYIVEQNGTKLVEADSLHRAMAALYCGDEK